MSLKTLIDQNFETWDANLRNAVGDSVIPENTMLSIGEDPTEFEQTGEHGALASQMRSIYRQLTGADDDMSQLSASEEEDTAVQAGVIAYLSSQTPAQARAYLQHIRSADQHSTMLSVDSVSMGNHGVVPQMDWNDYTNLAFDENELGGMATHNAVINMMASRQEPAAEALFPTKVISAKQAAINLSVDSVDIIHEKRHQNGSTMMELDRKKLNRALTYPNMLDIKTLKMIPWKNPDGSDDSCFVDTAFGLDGQKIFGHDVPVDTAPLAINKKVNLLGVCQHPLVLNNEQLNYTDQIAYGAKLSRLYIRVLDGANGDKVIEVDTLHRPDNGFLKSRTGQHRDTTLQMMLEDILISKSTKATDGTAIDALAATVVAQDLVVKLEVAINGNMRLNDGRTQVNAAPLMVNSVYDKDGNKLSLENGIGKTVVDLIEGTMNAEILGYEVDAQLSNTNWRMQAPTIDITPENEIYVIPPGQPLQIKTAPNTPENGRKISGLNMATMARNTNAAFTCALNYFEELKAHYDAISRGAEVKLIGTGRYLVEPYVNEINITIDKNVVVNHEGAQRHQAVGASLIYPLRMEAWDMILKSFYGTALKFQTGSNSAKPKVLLITDPTTARHLNTINGENDVKRMLGDNIEVQLEITEDIRFRGKIMMTLTRGRPGVEDLLSFGVHAYVTELSQTMTLDREGTTYQLTRIIPRNYHLPILPIMVMFNIEGLKDSLENGAVTSTLAIP